MRNAHTAACNFLPTAEKIQNVCSEVQVLGLMFLWLKMAFCYYVIYVIISIL